MADGNVGSQVPPAAGGAVVQRVATTVSVPGTVAGTIVDAAVAFNLLQKNLIRDPADDPAPMPLPDGAQPSLADDWLRKAMTRQDECIERLTVGLMYNIQQMDELQKAWKTHKDSLVNCGQLLPSPGAGSGMFMAMTNGAVTSGSTNLSNSDGSPFDAIGEEARRLRRSEFQRV